MAGADQEQFRLWLAESEELRLLTDTPSIPTPEDQKQWFLRSQEPDRRFFSIFALPEEELMGNGGLVDIDFQKKTAQFRITIGNSAYRGKGYGTEASRLILRFAFVDLGLSMVWLRRVEGNERAHHVYQKLGFQETGMERPGILRMSLSRSSYLSSNHEHTD